MKTVRLSRASYLLQLEILGAAWSAGKHGGDTSSLDRMTRIYLQAA